MAFPLSLEQKHIFSPCLCKYPSALSSSSFHYSSNFHIFSPSKHSLLPYPFVLVSQHKSNVFANFPTIAHGTPTESINLKNFRETGSGSYFLGSRDERVDKKSAETLSSSVDKFKRRFTDDKYRKRGEKGSGDFSRRPRNDNMARKCSESVSASVIVRENVEKKIKNGGGGNQLGKKKVRKGSGESNTDNKNLPEVHFRVSLDMCSKRGDVMGAIQLYDSARQGGITMGQYHYAVLLYLCSSAAVGVVRPAKSGSGERTLNADLADEGSSVDKNVSGNNNNEIWVSEDTKKYALEKGFEIYEQMCLEKVQMNEATLTSMARIGMSMGNGDLAFEMVKQMKPLGINPRLRSYGPALSVFCNMGDIDKAFSVEEHMLEHGVYPEEPELEALLKVSVDAGRGDKVYYLLHKLRRCVRKVKPSTANLILKWFESTAASRGGKSKWDRKLIKEAIGKGGGGWHGQGWLGRGKWTVSRTTVGTDGFCKCCGEKLATIDLDPTETENFAESVASIAIKREKNSSFQKFQKWLDYYGPFEAVVDAANVGLFSQKRFVPSKVNAVVNGIRQKLPSKRWPLIILHNKRAYGRKMEEPVNRALVEKWKNGDALYATPTGSNDDWYWLYAAIKFKCLLVTNDEMRDHTFQLLGNDFFPKWKERHQVHFSFSDGGPVFHMPPPCSVVIQESANGHWHVPVASEYDCEADRTWLCATRAKERIVRQDSATKIEEPSFHNDKEHSRLPPVQADVEMRPVVTTNHRNNENTLKQLEENYQNLRNILSASVFSNYVTVLAEIEAAEKLSNSVIDFQI